MNGLNTSTSARRHSVLSLDIGSSSVRATLFGTTGDEIEHSTVRREHAFRTTQDGGVETDADDLIRLIVGTVADCATRAESLGIEILGVGVSSFMHSLVGVDATGATVTPLFSWADTRSHAEVERLRERCDERAVHRRTGCRFHTTYFPAKLAWLRANGANAATWMSLPELLYARAFGMSHCHVSLASATGLYDDAAGEWDAELLAALSIPKERFFPILNDDLPVDGDQARGEFAAAWKPLAAAKFFPPLGDGACSNLGNGCATPDRVAINVGTSAAMRVVTDRPSAVTRGLWRYHVDAERYLVGGALSNAGNVFAWLRKTLRLPDAEALERDLAAVEPGRHHLTMLPFLAGERSPGWSPRATGVVAGLRLDTTPVEIVRGALETIALRLAWIAEEIEEMFPGPLTYAASGRALVLSPTWAQIMSDALGQPLARLETTEASARGAALWVLDRLGLQRLEDAPGPAAVRVEPDPEAHATYREALASHKKLYRILYEN